MKSKLDDALFEHIERMKKMGDKVFGEGKDWSISSEAHPNFYSIADKNLTHLSAAINGLSCLPLCPELFNEKTIVKGVLYLIKAFATQDPSPAHWDITRATIEIILNDEKKTKNEKTQIELALKTLEAEYKIAKELVNFNTALSIKITEKTKSTKKEWNLEKIEQVYLSLIGKRGKEGEKAKKQLSKKFQRWATDSQQGLKSRLNFWINTTEQKKPKHISKALTIFLKIFYKENLQQKVQFLIKYPDSTTMQTMQDLARIAAPGASYKKTKNEIQIYDKGKKPIGTIQNNSISLDKNTEIVKEYLNCICRQVGRLDRVYTTRIIEYFLKCAINCYIHGNENYDIEIPGRGKQLAKILGFTSGKAITAVNDIISLLNDTIFTMPSIKSRLISVAECEPNSRYSSKGGWLITLCPPFRPFQKKSLLVLLLKRAPYVGHNCYHSQQDILRWKIAIEAGNQSKRVAQEGSFIMTKTEWLKIFVEISLPNKLLPEILNVITGQNGYLTQVAPDRFSLREAPQQKFLENQGNMRIKKSQYGKNKKSFRQKSQ